VAELTYNSRIDAWLVVVTGLVLASLLVPGLLLLHFESSHAVTLLGVFALNVLVLLLFCYPCRYAFMVDHLEVQSGAVRMRVPYAEITAVTPSRSLWSGPALSLERVRIDRGARFLLVSPVQRDRFMAELRSRAAAARGAR
jgi:membrane protein YdbS with pleckstrin-like domain